MSLQETDSCVAASSQFVPDASELASLLIQQLSVCGEDLANPELFQWAPRGAAGKWAMGTVVAQAKLNPDPEPNASCWLS